MAKRRIRGRYGKQFYLNKFFHRGMLFTSSEMREGSVKSISNYNISPTGDSASPRHGFSLVKPLNENIVFSKYTYPVKFSQTTDQHYIEFLNSISEKEFSRINMCDDFDTEGLITPSIKAYSRDSEAMNDIKYEEYVDEGGNYSGAPSILIDSETTFEYGDAEDITVNHSEGVGYKYIDNAYPDGSPLKAAFWSLRTYHFGDLESEDYDQSEHSYMVRVIDGDTIEIIQDDEKESIRLLGIDAPEVTAPAEEWGHYASAALDTIIEQLGMDFLRIVKDPKADKDEYGRSLRWMFIRDGDYFYNLSTVMVRLGLAKMSYIYDNYVYTSDLIKAQNDAKTDGLKIWSSTETDPNYKYGNNNIDYSEMIEDEDDEIHVIPVRIDSSNRVTHKLVNKIDQIEFKYIDYLDAIAFLGLVIRNDTVLYKGLLVLKAISENDNINFELIKAPNDGQGEIPSIVESIATGFNLYNNEMVNLNNTQESEVATNILGIVPTDTTDSNNVVTQATPGGTVRLHGIINEGFFTPSSFRGADVKYDIEGTLTHKYKIGYRYLADGPYDGYIEDNDEIVYVLDFHHNKHFASIPSFKSYSQIIDEFNVGASLNYEELYNYTTVEMKVRVYEPSIVEDSVSTESTFDLEDLEELEIIFDKILRFSLKKRDSSTDKRTHLEIEHNVNEIASGIGEDKPEILFISKWEVAGPSEDWTLVKEYENYKLDDNGTTVMLAEENNYIDYTVEKSSNLSVKYTLTPAVKFRDSYIINEFAAMYQVMPTLKVSSEWKTINNFELSQNLDIRNATRLGIYNRQLYMYGPHIGSHTIQFTPFEKIWYMPFPYYNVVIDEPIIHVHPHKDSLFVFGQHNIYLLSGDVSVLGMSLFKIYENLSIRQSEINTVKSIGNNVMFFNNQMGYMIVPNKFTMDPEDIQVYKMSEPISNLLMNPEGYIKARTHYDQKDLYNIDAAKEIESSYHVFVEDNVVNILISYRMYIADTVKTLPVWCRYDQINNRWSLYDTLIYDGVYNSYICEPQLGRQYMVVKDDKMYFGIKIDRTLPADFLYGKSDLGLDEIKRIETFIDSGFLSVDTMNDKRFKDLMFEFNNTGGASLDIYCNFFVDGTPTLLTDEEAIMIIEDGLIEVGSSKEVTTKMIFGDNYGWRLSESAFGISERLRARIPVWGKGRMPQFTIHIMADDDYELLNFSLIYKEKNIERR